MLSTGEPAPGTDCHPDRSFSYPRGMRSGVEGPRVFCREAQILSERTKIMGAPLLAFCARGGCMWREKTQTEDATVDPPARCKKRKDAGHRRVVEQGLGTSGEAENWVFSGHSSTVAKVARKRR